MIKASRIHTYYGVALAGALMSATGLAHAQGAVAPPPDDGALTWHGLTLSGSVDVGLQYQPHAAPVSDYYAAGGYNLIQADSLRSVAGITPNNLSQSNITLSGIEPLYQGFSAIFKIQTLFQPNSGNLTDGIKSLVLNNGKAAKAQNNGQDSDAAGQAFAGALYGGVTSATLGTATYGWQTTLLSDAVVQYDPNSGSYAFSLIGQSGTARGGGDTQDKRFKNSLKYFVNYSGIHFGAMYEFADDGSGTANSAIQAQLGGQFAGLSVDAVYSKIYDAISAASLTGAVGSGTPGEAGYIPPTEQVGELAGLGYSLSNSVRGTISDNTTFAVLASYGIAPFDGIGPIKLFGAYEHVQFANPAQALPAGFVDLGGYVLAFVNNTNYKTEKVQHIAWAGAKWTVVPKLDVTLAYYYYKADSYETPTLGTCSTNAHANCSGTESVGSLDAVYHYTKRFDGYFGAMYSTVSDGLASGFKYTSTINPTVGVRFKF